MSWSPITLYYNMPSISAHTVTSEDANYPKENMLTRIDGTFWKATTTANQEVCFDFGSAQTLDFALVHGHNSPGGNYGVDLGWSDTSIIGGWMSVSGSADALVPGKTLLKTFTPISHRYWRLNFGGTISVPLRVALITLGGAVSLDHADAITPYDLENKGIVNVGDTGIVQGIHDKFIEQALQIKFMDADLTLTNKVIAWEVAVGLGLFGIRWDPGDHATDIRVMRRKDGKFTAPLKVGGTYADLTMNLIGRKE